MRLSISRFLLLHVGVNRTLRRIGERGDENAPYIYAAPQAGLTLISISYLVIVGADEG